MLRTALTDRFSLTAPIVGAPMAGVAGGRLAAAVSAGGGLGMIGVGGAVSPEVIQAEADRARAGGKPYGIGLMAWVLERRPEQADAVISARPDLVSISFGDYGRWVGRFHDAGIPVVTQAGDVDAARAAAGHGVDLIVARGAEGGGHGHDRVGTLPLLQGVLAAVDVPVLAAGGIATARGLAAVLAAGAAGAWIGTALLACPEGDNTPAARKRIQAANETGTVYTRLFDVGRRIPWPREFGGRALANEFSRAWEGRDDELAADEQAQRQLADAQQQEDYDLGCLYAGQAVGLVTEERPATTLVTELAAGAEELLRRWS
ncbi:MAG: nitronate monooxygenase [Nocardiopsaceae bacterium]|nr:nitronate monooxygenase [Nocardiopsaceae bacterium]